MQFYAQTNITLCSTRTNTCTHMYYSTQCDEIVHSPEPNQTKDSIEKSPELAKEALNESSRSDSIRTET